MNCFEFRNLFIKLLYYPLKKARHYDINIIYKEKNTEEGKSMEKNKKAEILGTVTHTHTHTSIFLKK